MISTSADQDKHHSDLPDDHSEGSDLVKQSEKAIERLKYDVGSGSGDELKKKNILLGYDEFKAPEDMICKVL